MKLRRSTFTFPIPMVVSALVDVVFLVLLFFLLCSRLVLQPGIALSLPLSSFNLSTAQKNTLVSIKAGTPPQIFLEDERHAFGDFAARVKQLDVRTTIILRADRTVPYDTVMRVSNLCLERGMTVVLATQPGKP